MWQLNKGEARVGMTGPYKNMDGTTTSFQIARVQDRGSYVFLEVRGLTKSGKVMKKIGTMGNDDLWIP
jgi:hypothetical protein